MFAPTKTFRKWHRKVNLNQRRYAVCSALAASALPALVMARGHRIENVDHVPLVLENAIESLTKTKDAVAVLKAVSAYEDVEKVADNKKIRAGKGKLRNRRHRVRIGPLVIYNSDNGIVKAFRNIPGVELVSVNHLNLLRLAPGGHVGRFVIWTSDAFKRLDELYGTLQNPSTLKKDYVLPQSIIANPDLPRLINSEEIQAVVRPANPSKLKRPFTQKKNPLRNVGVMVRLNPYAQTVKRNAILNRDKKTNKSRKRVKNTEFIKSLLSEN